jgi:hypothetical protein
MLRIANTIIGYSGQHPDRPYKTNHHHNARDELKQRGQCKHNPVKPTPSTNPNRQNNYPKPDPAGQ